MHIFACYEEIRYIFRIFISKRVNKNKEKLFRAYKISHFLLQSIIALYYA